MEQQQSSASIRDTIPPAVKKHFFTSMQPPNLLTDYDAVGFDADHCLVKYNNVELVKFLVKIEAEEFAELGWPKEMAEFDYENDLPVCLNATIFDIDNGLVIKLAKGQEVVQAMKGINKKLSKQEIESIYGSPPIFKSYQWPNTTHLHQNKGAYWVFMTYFDTPKVAVVLKAIELVNSGKTSKTYFDIAVDLRTMVYRHYVHYTEKEVHPIATFGRYFCEVIKNPSRFIQYQPELRDSLDKLRKAGKKVFLGTNSHTEYANLIMTATLGDDWRSFFDIICCACRKPLYFWDMKPAPFYVFDPKMPNLKGRAIHDANDLSAEPHQTYIEGNSKTLTHYFERTMGIHDREISISFLSREVRVAFFGDHYITDAHAASTNPGWDGIAVVEELALFDPELEDGKESQHVITDKSWGKDAYFADGTRGDVKLNYFIGQVEDSARYMLPFVRNIDMWINKFRHLEQFTQSQRSKISNLQA